MGDDEELAQQATPEQQPQEPMDSVVAGEHLLNIARERRIPLNITQLIKLLYICYGTSLAVFNRRFVNESVQAWPYGPVFPRVRTALKDIIDNSRPIEALPNLSAEDRGILEAVLRVFGTWTATQLVNWTHLEGSPWALTSKMNNFKWGDVINDDLIEVYFRKNVVRRREENNVGN